MSLQDFDIDFIASPPEPSLEEARDRVPSLDFDAAAVEEALDDVQDYDPWADPPPVQPPPFNPELALEELLDNDCDDQGGEPGRPNDEFIDHYAVRWSALLERIRSKEARSV